VITGYNTDVKHRDRVFHIQTEDRGDRQPYVESFVYVGGEILGGKRTLYPEALRDGGDERAVRELMEQQHRSLIAAIREEMVNEKVKVTAVSHPDSIYAGAIGAALWGAFRHQRLNAPAQRAAA